MLSTLSSNAVLAKAHAMYGRRLTKQNYHDLLACQTVNEVAYYLKNHTDYKQILSGINESEIHRGQLEIKLRQKLFEDYSSLCRYELSVGENFSNYLITRSEIEQIMHSLMLLNAGTPQEYLFSMPMFLNKHMCIDLPALARIKSYDDLLNCVAHTPYRKILEPFRPVPGIPLNYTGIEHALYTYLYKKVYEIIEKHTKGETAKQLLEIFNNNIDLYNYATIIRLKTFYQSGPDFIRSCLLSFGTLTRRQIDEMLAAQTTAEVETIMKKTSAGKRALKIDYDSTDQIINRVRYLSCRHDMHFSVHPSVIMLSYIFIRQTELADIINIIEGIRYKLPAEDIAKMLTIFNYS